ncbi:serine hydrolase domain-containing protein [Paenibacillus sp. GCM10012306]|uniref:serine hydrolase domain-containing protein n=1 Tax=Paenibacillus sp. GCM10012306 TaxID=3317342 RepID=UPI00360CF376
MVQTTVKNLPEDHDLSSKDLLAFFKKVQESNLDINSFILMQDGQAISQFYREPYRKDTPQLLFSLSKSFTSIAVGIAWDEGYFDLHDKVISFFSDKLPDYISPNLSQMTIHHLLSMTAGHQNNIYGDVVKHTDWISSFLSQEVHHVPGSYYRYSTHSTYMLSAIVERVTGQNLVDFLMPRLFEPLEIPRPSWETCPMGITAGGMGLSISTEGIARFGQMLLEKGIFKGRRIVSEKYINLATSKHADTMRDESRIDFSKGYGYQLFLCRNDCFMGNGGYGQLCFVAPKERIVIAATSCLPSMKHLQSLLDLVYEYILGQFNHGTPSELEDAVALQEYLSNVAYPFPPSKDLINNEFIFKDARYTIHDNSQCIEEVRFSFQNNQLEFQMIYDSKVNKRYWFEFDTLVHARDLFTKDLALHDQEVVTHAYWSSENTLVLTLFYIETPYVITYNISTRNKTIELQCSNNASLDSEAYTITGVL